MIDWNEELARLLNINNRVGLDSERLEVHIKCAPGHTPHFVISRGGEAIAIIANGEHDKENAERMVRAWNCLDRLVTVAKLFLPKAHIVLHHREIETLKALIAEAEGGGDE